MISVETAGVIAAIIPVGLLILGVEIRGVESVVATSRAGTVTLWLLGAIFVLGLLLGFYSEYLLIRALLQDAPLGVFDTVVVHLGLYFLGFGSFLLLSYSMTMKLGIIERMGRRSHKQTLASPRRMWKKVDYVDKHHPNRDR